MGLGAFPASGKEWLGMLGMHGTYEANLAMHDCDVMVCIGARFDDRITGRIDQFSPRSTKIHIDIDPSSINKNVKVDVPIIGDVAYVLEELIRTWKANAATVDKTALKSWWAQIDKWRARKCLAYKKSSDVIMPQYAIERLYALTRDRDVYITTEVGQHQMWAAQFFHFEEPNRWMTSGGLGTMGYGLPAAIGAQMAHPKSLVVDIAGDASILMNIQEMSTAVQYRLPVKVFILNNQYMGMVRQWQQLLHGNRISDSYTAGAARLRQAGRGLRRRRHPLRQAGRPRRCHHGHAERARRQAGAVRLPRRRARQLLPHDPLRQGAPRDAAGRGGERRGDRQGHRQGRQGAGVMRELQAGAPRAGIYDSVSEDLQNGARCAWRCGAADDGNAGDLRVVVSRQDVRAL